MAATESPIGNGAKTSMEEEENNTSNHNASNSLKLDINTNTESPAVPSHSVPITPDADADYSSASQTNTHIAQDTLTLTSSSEDNSELLANIKVNVNEPSESHTNSGTSNHDNSNSNNSSPPQPPKTEKTNETRNRLSAPVPISKRGRVLSLDRRGYMHHDNLDDDESDDSSSQNSDDGSYFSEHHLSPTSGARMVLPPRRNLGVPNANGKDNHNHNPRRPSAYQKSQSFGQNYGGKHTHIHHDSDLSLSSSSNDEDDYSTTEHVSLENSYLMTRTISAPEQSRNRGNGNGGVSFGGMRPGADTMDSDTDLAPVLPSISGNGNGNVSGNHKPPMPAREPLQVIGSKHESLFQPRNLNRFPSTSSLVSSSSEDVGDIDDASASIVFDNDNNHNNNNNSHHENESVTSKNSKHRRQISYRSMDSARDNRDQLKINVLKASISDDIESELSDGDSFVHHRRRRSPRHGHVRSDSIASGDSRIPLEIPSALKGGNGNVNGSANDRNSFQGLSDDQAKAWQNGNDSYMSSSISPDRRQHGNSNRSGKSNSSGPSRTLSNHSLHSSGMLVYSEDDTDESTRLIKAASEQGRNETNEVVAAGIGPVERRSGRSFGNDLTNSSSSPHQEPPGKAHGHNVDQHSSGRSADYYPPAFATRGMAPNFRGDDGYYVPSEKYKVYWQRWIMLMYLSILNLLSDWTCYSVAPIAVLTSEAFGNINPEHLVTIFLAANAVSTAMEPILLSRLGLRRTVVFGSFLLMCGSVVKSGGIPGIIGTELTKDDAEWRIYAGFLLVGLSQPLYQCTPTLLSCSWFPEKERTFATGVALNSNQLGIGFAFVFGTMLVLSSEDIPKYFGLLSTMSTLAFVGCFLQFKDAPPTPPSETARVIRGTLEMKIPYMDTMRQAIPASLRNTPFARSTGTDNRSHRPTLSGGSGESRSSTNKSGTEYHAEHLAKPMRRKTRPSSRSRGSPSSAFKGQGGQGSQGAPSRATRRSSREGKQRHGHGNKSRPSATADSGLRSGSSGRSKSSRKDSNKAPSPSSGLESTQDCRKQIIALEAEAQSYGAIAPSPMMNGRVGSNGRRESDQYHDNTPQREHANHHQYPYGYRPMNTPQDHVGPGQYYGQPDGSFGFPPDTPFANLRQTPQMQHGYPMHHQPSPFIPHGYSDTPQPYYAANVDPRQMYSQQMIGMYPPEFYQFQQAYAPPPYSSMQHHYPRSVASSYLPPASVVDDGAEPIMSQTGDNLDIDIRDDQIIRSIRACFSRKGFTHTVVAFAASGIVLNTLSTYMDYLVRLGGSGRQTVGIIGGLFQLLVMISSIIVGKFTDRSRSYYSVVIILLLFGAFALAECNINLDAARGDSLKWSLLLAACLIGPLQPISTELAVDVSFPLCSNTVLVIQQLCSNLLSALFIPIFQALKNYGSEADGFERPSYTFSFYLLIVIHGVATVFFATFNGKYMRLAHEQRSKTDTRSSSRSTGDKYGTTHDEEAALLP